MTLFDTIYDKIKPYEKHSDKVLITISIICIGAVIFLPAKYKTILATYLILP
jgi:hypothetical protein